MILLKLRQRGTLTITWDENLKFFKKGNLSLVLAVTTFAKKTVSVLCSSP